jgi:hypothetical protein
MADTGKYNFAVQIAVIAINSLRVRKQFQAVSFRHWAFGFAVEDKIQRYFAKQRLDLSQFPD